jgi:hypothetical protein
MKASKYTVARAINSLQHQNFISSSGTVVGALEPFMDYCGLASCSNAELALMFIPVPIKAKNFVL